MTTPVAQQPVQRPVQPVEDPVKELFASNTLAEHLVRGLLGLVLAVAALALAHDHPWALLGLPLAAAAWRGCPTCWSLGLAQTMSRGRARRTCEDGTCRRSATPQR